MNAKRNPWGKNIKILNKEKIRDNVLSNHNRAWGKREKKQQQWSWRTKPLFLENIWASGEVSRGRTLNKLPTSFWYQHPTPMPKQKNYFNIYWICRNLSSKEVNFGGHHWLSNKLTAECELMAQWPGKNAFGDWRPSCPIQGQPCFEGSVTQA